MCNLPISFYYGRAFISFQRPIDSFFQDLKSPVSLPSNYHSSSPFILNYLSKRYDFHNFVNLHDLPLRVADFQGSFRRAVKPYKHFAIPLGVSPSVSLAVYYFPDNRVLLYKTLFFSNYTLFFVFNFRLFFIYRFNSFIIYRNTSTL
jgi:hypothetical protein